MNLDSEFISQYKIKSSRLLKYLSIYHKSDFQQFQHFLERFYGKNKFGMKLFKEEFINFYDEPENFMIILKNSLNKGLFKTFKFLNESFISLFLN